MATIVVGPGEYEGNLEIDKELTLKSLNGSEKTTLNGTIEITADNVTVEGFTVIAPDDFTTDPVIHMIDANNVNILNNDVTANYEETGQPAIGTSTGPAEVTGKIAGNTVAGAIGVGTDGKLEVVDNTVMAAASEGIWFYPVGSEAEIIVTGNTIRDAVVKPNIKVENRPASINGETNELEMISAIEAANNNASVKLSWVTVVKSGESIQTAINEAKSGGTILVEAGTYYEQLAINKSLKLLGPNAGIAGDGDSRGEEAIITVPQENRLDDPTNDQTAVIKVEVPNVRIDGFRVTGDNGNESNYEGFTINAGIGIIAYEDNVKIANNVIDHFTNRGVHIARSNNSVKDNGQIENVSIASNYFEHIHDFNQLGYGFAIYVQGAVGTVTDNVVKESRTGIQVQPYGAEGDGNVENNTFEVYRNGIYYNYAKREAGSWTLEENTISAIEPSVDLGDSVIWHGIQIQTFGTEGSGESPDIVYFKHNDIDGTVAAKSESDNWSDVIGIELKPNIADNAEAVFEGNTISGVNIGVLRGAGVLDLEEVLTNNTFPEGSLVIGDTIKVFVPEENKVYNQRTGDSYDSIKTAIDSAEDEDTVLVASGTYTEQLTIDKPLTLIGAGDDETGTTIKAENNAVINLKAGNLTIAGVRLIGTDSHHGILTKSVISNIKLEDVTITDCNYGIEINNKAVVTDLDLKNVTATNNKMGMRVRGSLEELRITDSYFDGNVHGLQSVAGENDNTYLNDVYIYDSTFNNNLNKGIYLEKLSNAEFDQIEVVNSGIAVDYDYPTGVDINLKYADYENITIKNSKISGSDNDTVGHGLAIKARDDDDYAAKPASLTNVRVENVDLTGNRSGILVSGKILESGVVIVECVLENIGSEIENIGDNIVIAEKNWWGTADEENIQGKILGTVDYSPWYLDREMTNLFDGGGSDPLDQAALDAFVVNLDKTGEETFENHEGELYRDTLISEISQIPAVVDLMLDLPEWIEVISIAGVDTTSLTDANEIMQQTKEAFVTLMENAAELGEESTLADLDGKFISYKVVFGKGEARKDVAFALTFDTSDLGVSPEAQEIFDNLSSYDIQPSSGEVHVDANGDAVITITVADNIKKFTPIANFEGFYSNVWYSADTDPYAENHDLESSDQMTGLSVTFDDNTNTWTFIYDNKITSTGTSIEWILDFEDDDGNRLSDYLPGNENGFNTERQFVITFAT